MIKLIQNICFRSLERPLLKRLLLQTNNRRNGMLLNLHVKNFAIIDEVDVTFTDNLNILTGETGAGKSIIIGSINVALGGKIAKDIIRKGAEYALVELLFQIEDKHILEVLNEMDIPLKMVR